MNKKYLKYFGFAAALVFIFNTGYTQKFSDSGINFGLKVGTSKLSGELPYGFSDIIKEFDNKVGLAYAFEISKYVSPKLEIGLEIGYSSLNGNTNSPEFSAEGIQYGIPAEITEPVEYLNKLFSQNFFLRYFFKPAGSGSAFIPFVRVGVGYMNYNSKFKYIDADDDDLLFGKGTEGYTALTTPVFFLGTGFKTSLSSKFYMVTSLDFNMVNYDFLDVMHNYDDYGKRIELMGLYTEFKIGIFYNLSKSYDEKNNQNNNKSSGTSMDNYLPFSR